MEDESMSKVDGYSTYQKNYYDSTIQNKKTTDTIKKKEAVKTGKAEKTGNTAPAQLSDRAQELLEKLKKKYGNMDFMVANYENDEEAAEYLSRGTKQYSVLIEPELLEKMASDKDTEAKYTGIIENATEQFEEIKGELGNDLANVKSIGFNLKEDGTITLFADLEKASEQQRERIEKTKEEKKDSQKTEKADKAAEAYKEKPKHVRVYADSISELVDKIKNIDWYKVKAEEAKEQGSRLDFSV